MRFLNKNIRKHFQLLPNSNGIARIIAAFKARVLADSGTFEAESCLTTTVQDLVNSNLYDSASLIVTPNAAKAGKIYALKGTDLTFTRASVANRTNSVGVIESMATGVPRIEYPIGGGCPSILLEPQRTNLIPSCNLFTGNTTKTTGITDSPINGVTSVRSTKAISGTEYLVTTYIATITNATNYSKSLYFKYDGFDIDSSLEFNNGGDWGIAWKANIEIRSTGITVVLLQNCTSKLVTLANGWYRLELSFLTATVTTNTQSILIKSAGVLGASFLVCASQFEVGSFATSPILTAGAAVTRVADLRSNVTALGLLDFTWFFNFSIPSSTSGLFMFYNLAGSTIFYCAVNSSNYLTINSVLGGGSNIVGILNTIGTMNKLAIKMTGGFITAFINGVKMTPIATTATNMNSYGQVNTFGFADQYSYKLEFIQPSALSDSQCIALTT